MPHMDKLSTYRTTVVENGDDLAVTYVSTAIVKRNGNTITLDSGGWETVTTKRKMNQAARQFALGFSVYQKRGKWYAVTPKGETVPFYDGLSFDRY
jgi:hypothetical protein